MFHQVLLRMLDSDKVSHYSGKMAIRIDCNTVIPKDGYMETKTWISAIPDSANFWEPENNNRFDFESSVWLG